MASIYERAPLFKNQKTWSEKTPLGDVYKLQSNNPHNKFKAEIHKDSGNLGIEFTLDKTIDDFIRGAEKVDLDYQGSFLEFENVLQGRYLTDWKQVLHEHFPEPVDPSIEVPPEQDRSLAINFKRAIDLFLIKTLNEKMPRDRQYIYLAPGGDHVFHKELLTSPMDHLHRFQEILRISAKLPAGNIPEPNAALQVQWLYMSFHKNDRAEYIRSGKKLNDESLQSLAEYFESIHAVRVSDGSLMKKREEQIRQSVRREFERELRDKMSRFPRQEWKNKAYDKRGRDRDSKRASNTNDRGRSYSRRPDKNSNGERKSPLEQKSDKDFKPCHLHGAESKHSYDECRNNPKNFAKTNKSNDYVKKRGNDAHYYDARRPSNGEDSPTGNDTDVQSDDEIEDDSASESSKSASNYHVDTSLKKRSDDVGHKSPSVKKRKTLVEPILGLKKIPKKIRSSKSGGRVLNDVFENDVSDNEDERLSVNLNKKKCPSVPKKKGLSADAFGFNN